MSQSEINRAEQEVDQSTRELETALDHLQDKVEEGVQNAYRYSERASGVIEALKDPRAAIDRFLEENRPVIDQNVNEIRVVAERYLTERVELIRQGFREAVQESFNETMRSTEDFMDRTRVLANRFMGDVEGMARRRIRSLEGKPVTTAVTIFAVGWVLGAFFGRRGRTRVPVIEGESPESSIRRNIAA